jgi:2-aminoadipate transaminase
LSKRLVGSAANGDPSTVGEAAVTVEEMLSKGASGGIGEFFEWPGDKVTFNFDAAIADPESIPVAALTEIATEVARVHGPNAFGYFDQAVGYEEFALGPRGLRQAIATRAGEFSDSRSFGPDNVILTAGATPAIALVANGLLDAGDGVIVEEVGFESAPEYFSSAGAHVARAPVDAEGLVVEALGDIISQLRSAGRRLKLVYTIATFHTPTAASMSLARRRKLLQLAAREHFAVIEDNVFGDLRYGGEDMPSLLSLDSEGLVLQVDSFSKTVAPALRLGWVIGPTRAIAALGAIRQDLGISQWLARIMEHFMTKGLLKPHLEQIQAVYRDKRDLTDQLLQAHCAPYLRYRVPDGGLYFWIELDPAVDWANVWPALLEIGIYSQGSEEQPSMPGRKFMRLAFCQVPKSELARGIPAFGEVIAKHAARTPSAGVEE